MAHLVLTVAGNDETIPLSTKQSIVLGRDAASTLQIDDKRASRQHCRIHAENGHFVLEDLGSTNGTIVNEKRIKTHTLSTGDVIRIGAVRIAFHDDVAPRPKIDVPAPQKITIKLKSGKSRRGGGDKKDKSS